MQATIELDNRLMERAGLITGIKEQTALLHAGLKALIEREDANASTHSVPRAENHLRSGGLRGKDKSANQRLAKLGGSEPQLQPITRQRSEEDKPIQLCTEAEKRQRIQALLDFAAREGFPVEKLDIPSREERNAR
uniref:Antitoxin of type II TA system, VapB n=1 Tax=Candidatus Kentrum sp. DK TaxID=2126562 RepID=A0A450SJL6_9GAMM|nr:MAG: antitoxin of type II TA system, VapB [Candidatus Kentron sp. DK]